MCLKRRVRRKVLPSKRLVPTVSPPPLDVQPPSACLMQPSPAQEDIIYTHHTLCMYIVCSPYNDLGIMTIKLCLHGQHVVLRKYLITCWAVCPHSTALCAHTYNVYYTIYQCVQLYISIILLKQLCTTCLMYLLTERSSLTIIQSK